MSSNKRRCVGCKHFADAQLSGNGWCTHPKRQLSSDVRILVRKGELACRNSWGGDLWENADGISSTVAPKSLIPTSTFVAHERAEDQVTSVRSSGSGGSGSDRVMFSDPSFRRLDQEDVIVDHTSVSPAATSPLVASRSSSSLTEDDGLNTPAQEDQHERARAIAQGSRDAILRARERHTRNRRGADRMPAPLRHQSDRIGNDSGNGSTGRDDDPGTRTNSHADPSDANSTGRHDSGDQVTRRSGRYVHVRHDGSGPFASNESTSIEFSRTADDAAPTTLSPDPMNLVTRKVDRERFETVPDIKPAIELPRIRKFPQPGDAEPALQEPAPADPGRATSVSSYDLVLRRAQAIKNASKGERGGRPSKAMIPLPHARSTAAGGGMVRSPRPERVSPLPSITWEDETDPVEAPYPGSRLPDLNSEPMVSGRQAADELVSDSDHVDSPHGGDLNDAWRDDDEAAEPFGDDPMYPSPGSKPDHSRIWWRGLSLTRSRRGSDARHPGDVVWETDDEDAYESEPLAGDFIEDADDDARWEPTPRRSPSSVTVPAAAVGRSSRSRGRVFVSRDDLDRTPGEPVHDARMSRVRAGAPPAAQGSVAPFTSHEPTRYASRDRGTMRAAAPSHEPHRVRGTRWDDAPHGEEVQSSRERQRASFKPLEEETWEAVPSVSDAPASQRMEPEQLPEFDIRKLVARQDDLLDMTIALAPDLPRTCQTCRDFRPSESGERGWCTNDWAFTHRQMVNADSLPCQSSIGCWWLPNDASWMPAIAPLDQQRPTPRTDRLVAGSRANEADAFTTAPKLYVREI